MVRYADDFVVLVHGTRAQAEAIKETAATLLRDQLRLTLSPEKTRITHVDDGFDFLGFRIVRLSRPGRAPAAFSFPSRSAVNRLRHRIKTLTGRFTTSLSLDALLHALNPVCGVGPTTTATPRANAASPTSTTTCGRGWCCGYARSIRD